VIPAGVVIILLALASAASTFKGGTVTVAAGQGPVTPLPQTHPPRPKPGQLVEDKSARVLAEVELAEPSEHRIGRCTPCVRNIQGQRLPDMLRK
jgi:hypothetical protein